MSAKICHRKANSNTGIPGITEGTKAGRTCFDVSWRPSCRVRKATTFYFTNATRIPVLASAIAFRKARIAERAASEPPVVP